MDKKPEKTYTMKECILAIRGNPETDFSDTVVKDILLNTIIDDSEDLFNLVDELYSWRENIFFELNKIALLKQKAAF